MRPFAIREQEIDIWELLAFPFREIDGVVDNQSRMLATVLVDRDLLPREQEIRVGFGES